MSEKIEIVIKVVGEQPKIEEISVKDPNKKDAELAIASNTIHESGAPVVSKIMEKMDNIMEKMDNGIGTTTTL